MVWAGKEGEGKGDGKEQVSGAVVVVAVAVVVVAVAVVVVACIVVVHVVVGDRMVIQQSLVPSLLPSFLSQHPNSAMLRSSVS